MKVSFLGAKHLLLGPIYAFLGSSDSWLLFWGCSTCPEPALAYDLHRPQLLGGAVDGHRRGTALLAGFCFRHL